MKFTILTIDDEENIRNGLADNFELEGYEVKQAASGKEGLQLIEKGDTVLIKASHGMGFAELVTICSSHTWL